MKKRYLVLGNGRVFEGRAIGYDGTGFGELVFTTGMTGYLETLTDPSYAGQIVVQTFPLIGNYGVIEEDFEGESAVSGYVVRELCAHPSNFRSTGSLDDYLKKKKICGICGVDTRELTRILREEGVTNALLCDELPEDLSVLQTDALAGAVEKVTRKEKEVFMPEGEARFHVALYDYGVKRNIIRSLTTRKCRVSVLPARTPAEEIFALHPDGVLLSNGPGDPAENIFEIAQIEKIVGRLPVFGICLGHQLTALAMGGKTEKLKYGHRGANQPVRDTSTGRTYITSQNHGFAVVAESLAGVGRESFVNANDGSCEGMDYPGKKCFTVQFHPEACAGPRDTGFLFDRFLSMMEEEKKNAKGSDN